MFLSVIFRFLCIHGINCNTMRATATCSSATWLGRRSRSSIRTIASRSFNPLSNSDRAIRARLIGPRIRDVSRRFGDELNSTLLTKRALWCIRTILIARSAERRDPVFAPQRLAENTQSAAARDLLINRHIHRESAAVRQSLLSFLEEETQSNGVLETADRAHFIERFDATSNRVALQTLRQEQESRAGYLG